MFSYRDNIPYNDQLDSMFPSGQVHDSLCFAFIKYIYSAEICLTDSIYNTYRFIPINIHRHVCQINFRFYIYVFAVYLHFNHWCFRSHSM